MNTAIFKVVIVWWAWVGLQCMAINYTQPKSNDDIHLREKSARSARVVRSSPIIMPTIDNTFILRFSCTNENLKNCMTNFYAKAAESSISFRHIYTYAYAFPGIAIALSDPNDIRRMEEMGFDCLVEIESDSMLSLPRTENTMDDCTEGHDMIDLPRAHMNIPFIPDQYKSKKQVVKVALLDQGIPIKDKAFIFDNKEKFKKEICTEVNRVGCRVKLTFDFVAYERQGKYPDGDINYEPVHDEKEGMYGRHGTVMAGLIAGSRTVLRRQENKAPGLAQNVVFHDYRIVDETGRAPKSRTYAALDLAIKREADIICISLMGMDYDMRKMRGHFFKPNSKEEIFVIAPAGSMGKNNFLFQGNSLAHIPGIASVGSFFNPVHKFYRIKFELYKEGIAKFNTDFKVFSIRMDEFDQFLKPAKLFIFLPMRRMPFKNPKEGWAFNMFKNYFVILSCKSAVECVEEARQLETKPQILGILFECKFPLHAWMFNEILKPLGRIENFPQEFENLSFESIHGAGIFELEVEQDLTTAPFPAQDSSLGPSHDFTISPDVCLIDDGIRMYLGELSGKPKYGIGFSTSRSPAVLAGLLSGLFLGNKQVASTRFMNFNQDLYTRMQNTARPRMYLWPRGHLEFRQSDAIAFSVLKQGAGLIQAEAMLKTKMYILPTKVELSYHAPRDDMNVFKASLRIINTGPYGVVYELRQFPGETVRYFTTGVGYSFEPQRLKVEFFIPDSVKSSSPFVNPQFHNVYIEKESVVEFEVEFTVDREMPHYAFFSGYLQFLPIYLYKERVVQGLLRAPEYPTLSVPYLLFQGNLYNVPVIVRLGERAAFVATSKIEFVNQYINPDYPLRNPPRLPIYVSLFAIPEFTLLQEDRPVICMCPLLPLKALSFHLVSFPQYSVLGEIASYKNVPPACSLFLYPFRIEIGKPFPSVASRMDPSNLFSRLSHGWDGLYIPDTNRSTLRQVKCGHYAICAKVTLDIKDPSKSYSRYDWCSFSFRTGCAN